MPKPVYSEKKQKEVQRRICLKCRRGDHYLCVSDFCICPEEHDREEKWEEF